jgi:prepilin peptidase CpaA
MFKSPMHLNLAFAAAFTLILVWAAIVDARELRIPNWVPAALVVLFAVYVSVGTTSLPMLTHVGIAAAILVIGFGGFCAGLIGAGDVKLMAAVALWAGPSHVLPFLLFMALAGAALGGMVLATTFYFFWDSRSRLATYLSRFIPFWLRKGLTPYGVAIATGGLLTVPSLLLG